MDEPQSVEDSIKQIAACKARGICQRDQLVTEYIDERIAVYKRRMQSINESWREKMGLPVCPPICDTNE